MTNVDTLKQLGILGDVRQRLGAKDGYDDSQDIRINELSSTDIVAQWAGWELGNPSWWYDMKEYFDRLESNKGK